MVTIFIISGCKVDERESHAKNLDDFAAGKTLAIQSCGTETHSIQAKDLKIRLDGTSSLSKVFIGEKKAALDSYERAVRSYFSALPAAMQSYFTRTLRAEVMLTDDKHFDALCSGGPMSDPSSPNFVSPERRKDIASCISYQTKGKGQNLLAIVHRISLNDIDRRSKAGIELNIERIRHGGLRTTSMVFGQFIARQSAETDQSMIESGLTTKLNDRDAAEDVWNAKQQLVYNFLRDVADLEGPASKASLDHFNPILGKGKSSSIRSLIADHNSKDGPVDFLAQVGVSESKIAQFQDFVTAEAFDSMYCNTDTRKSGQKNFKRTIGSGSNFAQLQKALMTHATELASHFSDQKINQSEGLALAGSDGFNLQTGGCACGCNCGAGGSCSCGGSCPNCQNGSCSCNAGPATPPGANPLESAGFQQGQAGLMSLFQMFSNSRLIG
jgi:hypothetical protein